MSLLSPNEDYHLTKAGLCHVCHKPIEMSDVAISHDGHVGLVNSTFSAEGHGQIVLHTECATVLAMRLIHDAMKCRECTEQTPTRAIELLRRKAKP